MSLQVSIEQIETLCNLSIDKVVHLIELNQKLVEALFRSEGIIGMLLWRKGQNYGSGRGAWGGGGHGEKWPNE
jgi:hypothetical protein